MSETEDPKDVVSGTTVKRTGDGTEYELQPDVAGQVQLQPVDGGPDTPPVQMPAGQFVLSMKGGTYYFPNADTDEHEAVLKAVSRLRSV